MWEARKHKYTEESALVKDAERQGLVLMKNFKRARNHIGEAALLLRENEGRICCAHCGSESALEVPNSAHAFCSMRCFQAANPVEKVVPRVLEPGTLFENDLKVSIERLEEMTRSIEQRKWEPVPAGCYLVRLTKRHGMLDTGCRREVAGPTWHKEMQAECDARGIEYYPEPVNERYAFGAGRVYHACIRWVYPTCPHGKSVVLRIAEIEADVPGLLGPVFMHMMKTVLDFTSNPNKVTIGGVQDVMKYSDTMHPIVDLLPTTVAGMVEVEITVTVKNKAQSLN